MCLDGARGIAALEPRVCVAEGLSVAGLVAQ